MRPTLSKLSFWLQAMNSFSSPTLCEIWDIKFSRQPLLNKLTERKDHLSCHSFKAKQNGKPMAEPACNLEMKQ